MLLKIMRKIAKRSFKNVSQFKYLQTTVTNQNLIQEEIKKRLNSGNACYHSVQNLLSSFLLFKNVEIRMVLYGCKTWSLMLREEHRLRMFENKVLRIFGPKRDEVTAGWEKKLHNEELCNLYSSPSIIAIIKSRRIRGMHMGYCCEGQKERDHLSYMEFTGSELKLNE
jgi:hypothetical protein